MSKAAMRKFGAIARSIRIAGAGRPLFAASMLAVGIFGLIRGGFPPVWDPVPRWVPAREVLADLCTVISLASGIGLLWRRSAASAARVLLGLLLLWLLLFRVPVLFHAPMVEFSWEGCGETMVMVAGAWVLYGSFASDWDRKRLGFAAGENGVRIGRVLFGLALIPIGLSHLVYLKLTASLVPGWLPAHTAWAGVTGCAYIAAGLAVLVGILAPLAAALAALQMSVFTLLVWLPIIAAGSRDPSQWSETVDSLALTGAAWVIADSYRLHRAATSGPKP